MKARSFAGLYNLFVGSLHLSILYIIHNVSNLYNDLLRNGVYMFSNANSY